MIVTSGRTIAQRGIAQTRSTGSVSRARRGTAQARPLLGHQSSIGHAFHITSDEVLSWNQIYQAVADAAGVERSNFVHIASDFIAACLPGMLGGLHGDTIHSVVCDNTKINRFVPDFVATTRFRDGIRGSIAWFDADPARRTIDHEANEKWDRLIAAYMRGLSAARREFGIE